MNLADGKQKWKYKAGPFKSSPAVNGDAVYIGDSEGKFHCLDRATGKKRWIFETGGEITPGANFFNDLVLFGGHDKHLYCLTADGKEKWWFKIQGPIYGSSAVAAGCTFIAGCDSKIHVINIATGKEKAAIELGSQSGATVAVVGDHLYIGTMGKQFKAIDWKKKTVTWTFQSTRRAQPFYSSAAVTDDLVVKRRSYRHWQTPNGSERPIVWPILINVFSVAGLVLTFSRGPGYPLCPSRLMVDLLSRRRQIYKPRCIFVRSIF